MHPTTFFSEFRFPSFVTAVVVLAWGVFGETFGRASPTAHSFPSVYQLRHPVGIPPHLLRHTGIESPCRRRAFATLDRVRDDGVAQLRAAETEIISQKSFERSAGGRRHPAWRRIPHGTGSHLAVRRRCRGSSPHTPTHMGSRPRRSRAWNWRPTT